MRQMTHSHATRSDPLSVESKVVVITGGLGQLGSQFARTLLERGAAVALLDVRDQIDLAPTRVGTWLGSDRLICIEADVTKRPTLEAALREIEGSLGAPNGLINCAAIDSPPNAADGDNPPFERYPESTWQRVMDVNVTGVFLSCQVFGTAMAEAGNGSIVNISSIYGLVSPDQRLYEYRRQQGDMFYKPVGYAVSKSALLNLTRYLATTWAERGVRVNTVTFGGVFNGQDDAFVAAYAARTPMGRMARPDEYDGAIVYLLSDASSYMTGSNLVVDGGWTAW